MIRFFELIGKIFIGIIEELGGLFLLLISSAVWMLRPPFRFNVIMRQMEFVGVNSIIIVLVTALFTGMVFALQTYHGFKTFGAESLVGPSLALAVTRELGPVFTALMVTGRAGSAMAAEIGTMKVTEQIDALHVMSVNPIQYLVMPRILAGIVMLPVLTAMSDFIAIVGGYFVGVELLDINSGIFLDKINEMVGVDDVFNGLVKSTCFGLILTLVGCYKGINTKDGAKGVGKATTQAVVFASVAIFISDYILTTVMF